MVEIFDPLGVRQRFDGEATNAVDVPFFPQMPIGATDGAAAFPNLPLSVVPNRPELPQAPREIPLGAPFRLGEAFRRLPPDAMRTAECRVGECELPPSQIGLAPLLPNQGVLDPDIRFAREAIDRFDDPRVTRPRDSAFIDPTFARPLPRRGDEDRFRLPIGADGRIEERQLVPGRKFVADTDGTEWRYNGDKFVKQSSPKRRLTLRQMQKRVTGQGPTAVRVTPEEMQNQVDLADATQRADPQKGVEVGGSQAASSGSVASEAPFFSFDENDPKFMSQFPPGVDPRAEAQKIANELRKERGKSRLETLSETLSDTLSTVVSDALDEGQRISVDLSTDALSPLQPWLSDIDPDSKRHTHRNIHNRCPMKPPKTSGGADSPITDCEGNVWEKDDDVGDFHGASKGNHTYRAPDPGSDDGGFQCTYTDKDELVDSGPFMGTYDYTRPPNDSISLPHVFDDVVTHKKNSKYAPNLTRVYCK